jgi:hypothetical protein
MTDTVLNSGAPEAAVIPPPKVRMDRSRAFSTVHGTRTPDDPLTAVHYIQDGIPADAGGFFIFDHPMMLAKGKDGDKMRAAASRKIERALKQAAKAPPPKQAADDADEDANVDAGDEEPEDDLLEPINLEAWLRGEQEVEWQEVTQELARRFKVRKSKVEDAVEFLVKEGVVPKAQLRKKFQKFVD